MSVVEFPSPAEQLLKRYYERGFRLVFYPSKLKNPEGSDAKDWPSRTYELKDYIPGQNVGVMLGVEIQPGQFLADIDFDWEPGIELSGGILPGSRFVYGHAPTKPISHAFYTTPEPVFTKKYENIQYPGQPIGAKSQQCFVELRGVKKDGTLGAQTMVPPSLWVPKDSDGKSDLQHPGEPVIFYKSATIDAELGHSDGLGRRVSLYAIACLLHNWIPKGALKHEMRMALAGFLLGLELNKEETTVVLKALVEYNGPHDKGDEVQAIESTLVRIARKQPYAGRGKLSELLGEYGHKITSQVVKWVGGSEFVESKGKILPNTENIKRAFELIGVELSYNTFSNKSLIYYPGSSNTEAYNGDIQDDVRNNIRFDIERNYRFLPEKTLCYDVMDYISWGNRFHPVLDYLQPLKWDQIPRLDEWLIRSAKAVDSPYVRAVSSLVLLAAVRRVTQPGCKFDEMMVLESGTQGLLKSTALRTLCPNEDWFSDNLPLNLKSQQIIELTAGKWIIEASELNNIRTTQMEQIKALLSRQDDVARLAYRHDAQNQRRQFIIIGTTNSYHYLTDQTGNRRFWPVRVDKFDIQWLLDFRDQIWAEAFAREQSGASIRLPESLYKSAESQQSDRMVDDDWRNLIDQYFVKQHQRAAWDEIWEILGIAVERRDINTTRRVADIMQSLGFERASTLRDRKSKISKGWKRDWKYSDKEWQDMRGGPEVELKTVTDEELLKAQMEDQSGALDFPFGANGEEKG